MPIRIDWIYGIFGQQGCLTPSGCLLLLSLLPVGHIMALLEMSKMSATRQTMPITILYAEDDEDDRLLAREALSESRLVNDLRFAENGEETLDYLYQRGKYSDAETSPRPGLILLDLNMPKIDGREVLRTIKSDPDLKRIPVVVLTTSKAEEDIIRSYDLGVNSFVTKPVTFEGLVEAVKQLGRYWLEIVVLPS